MKDTVQLNFKKLGHGQPLIILHGLFGSLDNWMSLAKEWSSKFEVWLVDQRNHGQSPHSNAFSYTLMAEDLKAFIAEHRIEDPYILGHSMGGKTAMEYAVNHPDALKKLIVVDIAPVSYEVHHYSIIAALESVDLNHISSRKEADVILAKSIEEFGIRQFLLKNLYWKEKGQLNWRFNIPIIKSEIIPISEWEISNHQFEGETLFIKGEKSNYILPQYAMDIQQKFPNYQIEEIAEAGHWVHAEKKEPFSHLVLQFLS